MPNCADKDHNQRSEAGGQYTWNKGWFQEFLGH